MKFPCQKTGNYSWIFQQILYFPSQNSFLWKKYWERTLNRAVLGIQVVWSALASCHALIPRNPPFLVFTLHKKHLEKTFRRVLTLLKFQKELVRTWGSSMAAAILGSLWKAEIPVSHLLVSPLEEKVGSTAHTIATISQWNSSQYTVAYRLCYVFFSKLKLTLPKWSKAKTGDHKKTILFLDGSDLGGVVLFHYNCPNPLQVETIWWYVIWVTISLGQFFEIST